MSLVGASMYCSPHPAALHIAPAAQLHGFYLYDSAPGSFITGRFEGQKIVILSANLFILLGLRFNSAVLMVFLRQDESA